MPRPLFDRVMIVGVGLIGSSMGMEIVQKKLAREVIGIGRSRSNLREAVRKRAIHRGIIVGANLRVRPSGLSMTGRHTGLPLPNLSEKDLVILATPVSKIVDYLPLISKKALVTDVGSTKRAIVRSAHRAGLRFVGSHPIAGTEKSGAKAGELGLFRRRTVIVTPGPGTRPGMHPKIRSTDVLKIKTLWRRLGAETLIMTAERHDQTLAALSHLPHILAFSLVPSAFSLVPRTLVTNLSLGSLKSATRVAESSAETWRDIFLQNRDFVLKALKRYEKDQGRLRALIQRRDAEGLLKFLKTSQRLRSCLS